MPDPAIAAFAEILDRVVADPAQRDAARARLLTLAAAGELDRLQAPIAAAAEAGSADPWTRRSRPAFLWVMYALLLCAIPLGLVAAIRPDAAAAFARGMTGYLGGIPEPLYALFGTGYLGYTAARSWGKARGVER